MNDTNTTVTPAELLLGENGRIFYRMAVCIPIIVLCVLTFGMMITAPRIAQNIRYASSNIIFYDICVVSFYLLHHILNDSPKWFYYRATHFSVLGQWFAVTGFSFERLIAIACPFMYRKFFKTTYVKSFVLVELICFLLIVTTLAFFKTDPVLFKRICFGGTSLHGVLSVFCVVCITKTLIIFKQSTAKFQSNFSTFRTINKSKEHMSFVCTLFVLSHIPVVIETFFRRCEFTPEVPLYTNYILILNSAVDPLLYAWRFRECRFQMLKTLTFFPCFRFLEETVRARRMDIYNIPLVERSLNQKRANRPKAERSLVRILQHQTHPS